MGFDDALRTQVPPERVGEVRLRFEESLLIGERPGARTAWPELLGIGAVGSGVGSLAALLSDGSFMVAVGGVLLAAGLTAGSVISRGRLRGPQRFILNFATETLRLDAPGRSGRVASEFIPFDAVKDLQVVSTRPHTFGLLLEYTRPGGGLLATSWLVQHSPAAEIETLRQLWRILRHAFGL